MSGTVSEVVTEIKIGTGGLPIENELLSEIAKEGDGVFLTQQQQQTTKPSGAFPKFKCQD